MPLTPADVHNVAFKKPPIGKRGYDEEEVDKFLDEIEAELARLIEENNELRDRADKVPAPRGAQQAAPEQPKQQAPAPTQAPQVEIRPDPAQASRIRELEQVNQRLSTDNTRLVQEHDQLAARQSELHEQVRRLEVQAREAASRVKEAPVAPPAPPTEMEHALSVLTTAQRTADDHIAAARAEAEKMLSSARAESDDLSSRTSREAEKLSREARQQAETLERDARQRHQEAMGGLEIRRAALQKHIEELRVFATDYRSRIQAYLEGQLRDLSARGQELENVENGVTVGANGSSYGSGRES